MIARIVSICPTFVANGYFKKKKQEEGAFAYSLISYSVNLQVPIGKPEWVERTDQYNLCGSACFRTYSYLPRDKCWLVNPILIEWKES